MDKKFMKSSLLSLTIFAATLLFFGCKDNPYPSSGNYVDEAHRSPQEPTPMPPLTLFINSKIEFNEGRILEYPIKVFVKPPGKPIVTIDNLPAGAEFDDKNFIIKWRPSFTDGNDPNDPKIKSRLYTIKVWLRNSMDNVSQTSQVATLEVRDTPRPINISDSSIKSVYEGDTYSNIIKIDNLDYPNGPFKIVTNNFPPNAKLIKIDSNTYKIEFELDHYQVNLKKGETSKRIDAGISVINPSNDMADLKIPFSIYDARLPTQLATPEEMTQGLDVSFQVVGHDLNREVSPKISITSPLPSVGSFRLTEVKNAENFSTIGNIEWVDIPPSYNGKTFNFAFKFCVLDEYFNYNNCTTKKTAVTVKIRDRKAPVIDRANWPVGDIAYLNYNQKELRKISIVDNENPAVGPKVEVFPESMREFVTWNKNLLSMQFNSPGIYQFNIIATSEYNISRNESFLVEVFPKERNQTIFFADSSRDPEASFYKQVIKEVDIFNPNIQDISLRDLAGRSSLILGTSILIDDANHNKILSAASKIKNLIIATPLIEELPKSLLEELQNDYGLSIIGRYNDLPNPPPIEKMLLATTTHFETPSFPVGLKLTSTVQSKNPLIFNGGLDDPNKICKGVLGLSPDKFNPYVLGVVCNKKNGGRVALLGTEWSELKTHTNDIKIPFSWFTTFLNEKF